MVSLKRAYLLIRPLLLIAEGVSPGGNIKGRLLYNIIP
jgi:hypothetical protein